MAPLFQLWIPLTRLYWHFSGTNGHAPPETHDFSHIFGSAFVICGHKLTFRRLPLYATATMRCLSSSLPIVSLSRFMYPFRDYGLKRWRSMRSFTIFMTLFFGNVQIANSIIYYINNVEFFSQHTRSGGGCCRGICKGPLRHPPVCIIFQLANQQPTLTQTKRNQNHNSAIIIFQTIRLNCDGERGYKRSKARLYFTH